MIQRIQSLFLFFVVLSNVAIFFFPIANFLSELFYVKLYVYQFKNFTPDSELDFSLMTILPLLINNGLVIILALFTILKFKTRLIQLRLTKINILLTIFLIVGIFFGYPYIIEQELNATSSFETGAYFPLISLMFLVLAHRSILKDEKLVKSVDRLR